METLADLRVELFRAPGKSLGISIVGGRGMGSRLNNGEVMRGIFIKHILVDSPAGQNGTLKTGDRIVEVKEVKQGTFKFETPKPGVVSQYQTIDLTLTFWKMYLGGWSWPQRCYTWGSGGGYTEGRQPRHILGAEYDSQAQGESPLLLLGNLTSHFSFFVLTVKLQRICTGQIGHFQKLNYKI